MATIQTQGCQILKGDGASPEVFTALGEVIDISLDSGGAAEIDVTNLDSTAKEFNLGLADYGTVSITMNYDPDDAQQTALKTDYDAQDSGNYRIDLSDSPETTFSFAAYVRTWNAPRVTPDDVVKLDAVLRISGAVTVA